MTQANSKLPPIEEDGKIYEAQTQQVSSLSPRWHRLREWITSNWVLSVVFGAIALCFNLYRLGVPSIWFDEAFSVELARQPLPILWHLIFGPEPNMELYYLFLHGWLAAIAFLGLHPTEFVVRLPSALFAALSTIIVFLLGRRFLGLSAAIVGSSLYLLNYLQLLYAQQTRSYSLQLLLLCLAWYAFLAATMGDTRQKRWWICFVVATTLAIYAHLFSLFILLAQYCTFGLWLLLPAPWRKKAHQQLLASLVSLVVISVLITPILLVGLHGNKTGWLAIPHLPEIVDFFLVASGTNKDYLLLIVLTCLLGLGIALVAYFPALTSLLDSVATEKQLAANKQRLAKLQHYLPIAVALICWLFVPIVASFIVSQGSTRLFSSRYLVVVIPPLMLWVGMSVTTLRWRHIQVILSLILLMLALYAVPFYYRSAQVEDWNTTSLWLEQQYQAGDGLVCYDNAQGCQVSVEYYLHAYPSLAHFTPDTPGAFSWASFGSPRSNAEVAVDPVALASFGSKYDRIFFIVGRLSNGRAALLAQQAQSWLDSHYHLVAQIVKASVTVRLYATRPIDTTGTFGGIS